MTSEQLSRRDAIARSVFLQVVRGTLRWRDVIEPGQLFVLVAERLGVDVVTREQWDRLMRDRRRAAGVE